MVRLDSIPPKTAPVWTFTAQSSGTISLTPPNIAMILTTRLMSVVDLGGAPKVDVAAPEEDENPASTDLLT